MYTRLVMSKTRKIILITLINIAIMLWLTLIYSVFTHKEDPTLINYQSPKEEKEEKLVKPKMDMEEDPKQTNEHPGF